jgi:hypothetical protein
MSASRGHGHQQGSQAAGQQGGRLSATPRTTIRIVQVACVRRQRLPSVVSCVPSSVRRATASAPLPLLLSASRPQAVVWEPARVPDSAAADTRGERTGALRSLTRMYLSVILPCVSAVCRCVVCVLCVCCLLWLAAVGSTVSSARTDGRTGLRRRSGWTDDAPVELPRTDTDHALIRTGTDTDKSAHGQTRRQLGPKATDGLVCWLRSREGQNKGASCGRRLELSSVASWADSHVLPTP